MFAWCREYSVARTAGKTRFTGVTEKLFGAQGSSLDLWGNSF